MTLNIDGIVCIHNHFFFPVEFCDYGKVAESRIYGKVAEFRIYGKVAEFRNDGNTETLQNSSKTLGGEYSENIWIMDICRWWSVD